MHIIHRLRSIATAAGIGFAAVSANAHTYSAIDLGAWTQAYGLNNAAQVSGSAVFGSSGTHAFVTAPGGVGMTDLGILGGNDDFSRADAINDRGQVAGTSSTAEGPYHAFLTGPDGVGKTDLGTLPGGSDSHANGVNASGQVVGSVVMNNGQAVHAFVTGANGVGMTDLGTLGGSYGNATAINDRGQIVGTSFAETGSYAFIAGPGLAMTSLGTLGGYSSSATAINASGQVTGYAGLQRGSAYHAFITGADGIGMTDLGTLEGAFYSFGNGINASGQVVGRASSEDYSFDRAFITGANGVGMTDLNTLVDLPDGVVLYEALAINDAGWVLAEGRDLHAYLLAPTTAVPESSTFALMMIGLFGIARARARR